MNCKTALPVYLALILGLSACGEGPSSVSPEAKTSDTFVNYVKDLASTTPDSHEAIDVSAIETTSPDNAEPVYLP